MRPYRGLTKDGKLVKGWYARQNEGEIANHYIFEIDTFLTYEVIPETVGQSTGLKDKDGKEGYYQDISKDKDGDIYVIAWDRKRGIYYLRGIGPNCIGMDTESLDLMAIGEQEIIGNIHQNSNLLKD